MMKKLSAVILIIIFSLQSFYPLAVYSIYFANQDYIAAELCENIERPELNCKGSCFVDKQLTKAEESKTNQQETSVVQVNLFSENNLFIILSPEFPEIAINFPRLSGMQYATGFLSECFTPPKASAIIS